MLKVTQVCIKMLGRSDASFDEILHERFLLRHHEAPQSFYSFAQWLRVRLGDSPSLAPKFGCNNLDLFLHHKPTFKDIQSHKYLGISRLFVNQLKYLNKIISEDLLLCAPRGSHATKQLNEVQADSDLRLKRHKICCDFRRAIGLHG